MSSLTVVWLSAAGFVVIAVMRVIDPLLPVISGEFGLSAAAGGAMVAAFALPYGALQLVYGPLGDRIGKLRVVAAMLAVSGVFTAASAFAPGAVSLMAMRFMTAVAMAAVVPLSLAHIADHVDYARRQATIARYLSGLIAGQIVGGSLGGAFADFLDWRAIFLLFAALSTVIALGLWPHARAPGAAAPPVAATWTGWLGRYRELLREPRTRDVIVAVGLESGLFFGGFVFIGAGLHARFGLGFLAIGLVLSGYGVGGLIYSGAVKHVVRALGERGMVAAGGLVIAACFAGLAAIDRWQWSVPLLVTVGFGYFMMHNTLQTLATELVPHARGTAVSLFAFAMFAGQGVGVAVCGPLIDHAGYGPVWVVAGTGVGLLGLWFQSRIA